MCQMNPTVTSTLELVSKFFAYYSTFDWAAQFVSLNPSEVVFQRDARVRGGRERRGDNRGERKRGREEEEEMR